MNMMKVSVARLARTVICGNFRQVWSSHGSYIVRQYSSVTPHLSFFKFFSLEFHFWNLESPN